MGAINTHGMVCNFGRHKGVPYTRIPVSYLKWMIVEGHPQAEIAKAELDRRGTPTPTVDVSGHAIDRASLSCRKTWHHTKKDGEGLYSWLCRMTEEALKVGLQDDAGRYLYNGMKMAIEDTSVWPVLKTVMPDDNPPKGEGDAEA